MKVYWVTGASSGIGEALAKELFKQGHSVILSARNVSKLEQLKKQLGSSDKIKILNFDITDIDQLSTIASQAKELFGRIDVIVLNAGLSQRSLVQETTFQVYRDIMELNYFGNVALTKSILPIFTKQNSGQFVVITSLVGKFGTPYRSGYSASKHALHGFYDSLRAELMMNKQNIDVTIICPGFVSTNVSFNALGADGNATQVYDESNAEGMSPENFAKLAVPVIESKKFEAYIGGKETKGVLIKRLFPGLFAKLIAKAKVR